MSARPWGQQQQRGRGAVGIFVVRRTAVPGVAGRQPDAQEPRDLGRAARGGSVERPGSRSGVREKCQIQTFSPLSSPREAGGLRQHEEGRCEALRGCLRWAGDAVCQRGEVPLGRMECFSHSPSPHFDVETISGSRRSSPSARSTNGSATAVSRSTDGAVCCTAGSLARVAGAAMGCCENAAVLRLVRLR